MITLRNVYSRENWDAYPATIRLLYDLLLERPPEARISHRAAPPYEQHVGFVRSRPYQHWYIVMAGEQPVGAISASKLNEIGIAILKAHQGKGYAAAAITQFMLEHRPLPPVPSQRRGTWVANVAPDNAPSHALFKRLGGRIIQTTYEL